MEKKKNEKHTLKLNDGKNINKNYVAMDKNEHINLMKKYVHNSVLIKPKVFSESGDLKANNAYVKLKAKRKSVAITIYNNF